MYLALALIIQLCTMSVYADVSVTKYSSYIIAFNGTAPMSNSYTVTTSADAVFQLVWVEGKDIVNPSSGIPSGTTVTGMSNQIYGGNAISEDWFSCTYNTDNCPGLDSLYSKTQTVFSFSNNVTISYSVSTANGAVAVPFQLMLVAVDIPFCDSSIVTFVNVITTVSTQYQSYATASCGYLIETTTSNTIPEFQLTDCSSLDGTDQSMTLYYGSEPSAATESRILTCKNDDGVTFFGQDKYLYIKYDRINASITSVVKFKTSAFYGYWYPTFAWIWFILFILLLSCVIVGCVGMFLFPSKKKRETTQQAAAREANMNFSNLNYNEETENRPQTDVINDGPPSYDATDYHQQPPRPATMADQLDSDQLGQLKQ